MDKEILKKIYKFCAYQERYSAEVKRKLHGMGTLSNEVPLMLVHLEEEGFLNDTRYAHSFARGKFSQKKWGKIKIRQSLREKGIDDTLIYQAILQEIEEEDYLQTLSYLVEKKKKDIPDLTQPKEKAKMIRFLQQKGYETSLIFKALQEDR
ncbi:MAG: regulatory protein RecX [Bacteroidota bacterium]